MKPTRRKFVVTSAVFAISTVLGPSFASASEKFPERPIQFIVPYSPGGSADTLARTIGNTMAKELGQPVIIENRGGGAGVVGASIATRAKPDGYTLFLGGIGFNVISPILGILPDGYDPDTQLEPVSKVANYRILLVVHPDSPIRTFQDLLAQAKSPKGVSYGTAGVTTTPYIGALAMQKAAGVEMVHIPYKGEAPAALDVMGEQIDMSINGEAAVMSNIRAGKLRPILTMDPKRLESLPDVPSITEFYPGLGTEPWFGAFTTPGTPPEVLERLAQAFRAALTDPEVAEKLKSNFYVPSASENPSQFKQALTAETEAWNKRLEGVELNHKK